MSPRLLLDGFEWVVKISDLDKKLYNLDNKICKRI